MLFIAFAEDRNLLPPETLKEACSSSNNKFNPRPVWESFQTIFRWIDEGNPKHQFPAYNGGLFKKSDILDHLEVSDAMCEDLGQLARYDFREDVSVDVLGHIFEQSITDLEEMRARAANGDSIPSAPVKASKRHAQGIYYTPAYITRFIVDRTLGRIFDERWQLVLAAREPDKRRGKEQQKLAWIGTYEAYRDELKKIQVLDPACGSGAFLVAAFDALGREYERINAALAELREGQIGLFDLTKTVLNNNLFGVDLNSESVEITKLSLWLKTAERGRKLTYLDSHIKWGNSIIKDPRVDRVAFDWGTGAMARSFLNVATEPEAADIDARWLKKFDVVIGNPPYIRHELLGQEVKSHLETTYVVHHGMADIFVYFFERGLSVLRPGGRLGLIVTNKWLRSEYAEPLRLMLARQTWIETLVDFGHAPIFPDADVFPCIIALKKPDSEAAIPQDHTINVTSFPRALLNEITIPEYVASHHYEVPQGRLNGSAWSLEPTAVNALMNKVRERGTELTTFVGAKPYRGIVTGFNDAFLVDTATKNNLVASDPGSLGLFHKYLRGQDIGRWAPEWHRLWMIHVPWDCPITEYPSVLRHMELHRAGLEARPEVQAKRFPWYAMSRYASDYWHLFAGPKIFYQVIQFYPAYALDRSGLVSNDKGFFIPSADTWLLAVLNSPLMWWHNWRYLTHMKDEALTPLGVKMERLPIAVPTDEARVEAERIVPRLVHFVNENNETRAAVLDSLRMQFGVETPGRMLEDFAGLTSDAFLTEVLKRRPKSAGKLKASDMKALRGTYDEEALPIQTRLREARELEKRLTELVNDAYGLTLEEIELMWSTAPPRMPGER